jgi:ABC-2 type transport system permease protein
MKKIQTIFRKEWMEVFRNRLVIFSVIFLPIVMTAIPLIVLYSTRGAVSASAGNEISSSIPAGFANGLCTAAMTGAQCFQIFLVNEFMVLFMIIPAIIPVNIAAYSIVGEKNTRSLEALLATPITTAELLVGKCAAAVIPAILATIGSFAIFIAGAWIIVGDPVILGALLEPRWLIAVLMLGPLLAILSVGFALIVSSRVNDPRVAEQLSAVVILPVLVGFIGQMAGLFVLNAQIVFLVTVVMAAIDAFVLYLATQLFQRETILTRWK